MNEDIKDVPTSELVRRIVRTHTDCACWSSHVCDVCRHADAAGRELDVRIPTRKGLVSER